MSLQYLPGTASLLEELDKKLMVLLRDGRTLIGYLRSVDQFANLVLHRCIERIHVGSDYGDIPRAVFIVRGENVVSFTFMWLFTTKCLGTPPPLKSVQISAVVIIFIEICSNKLCRYFLEK